MSLLLRLVVLSVGLAGSEDVAQPLPPRSEVYTTTVAISTYPYDSFLQLRHSDTYNMDYHWLNWSAYQASNPHGTDRDYTLVVLENEWLRLSVMPDLGGRLYGVTIKATGEELFYQNPVIKPTHWGPEDQGWWLAAGGLEWGLPVEEHGYEWGVPWGYSHATTPEGSRITLWDTLASDRIRARVRIELPAGEAAFRVVPRLENPTTAPVTFKFWDNAMLAPGAPNTVGPDLHFVMPIPQVTVHSRGDWYLPAAGEPMSWPVYEGTDYSRLGNWNRWLGFFARPQAVEDWAGVYDLGIQRGIARVYPHEVAVGVKGFGMGWGDPIDWREWTDIQSYYVELHGGPAPTFWDSITLQPGEALEWTETWLPLRELPALSLATEGVALGVAAAGGDLDVGVVSAAPRSEVRIRLWRRGSCEVVWEAEGLTLIPGQPYGERVQGLGLGADEVVLGVFLGHSLLASTGAVACPPPASRVLPLDPVQTSEQFLVHWVGEDAGGGLASYDIQVRDGDADALWGAWLVGTADTQALFEGQAGHTYTFRSRARDAFDSQEAWPAGAWQDTFTTILLQPAPVLITSSKEAEFLYLAPGQATGFQMALRNTGNLSATVAMTDVLPAELTLTAGPWISPTSAPPPVVVGDTILWSGDLEATPNRHAVTIGFEATVPSAPFGGPITNTVWIDDGAQAPLARSVTLQVGYAIYLPLAFRVSLP